MSAQPGGAQHQRPRAAASSSAVVLIAIAAVAINLRLVMSSVPPLVEALSRDLRLGAAAVGALTTLPVLCMGLFAPSAQAVAARVGAARAVLLALGLLAAGSLVRGLGGPHIAPLYLGTFVAGVGIALVGTLLPSLVKTLFPPARAGLATSYYFLWMMVGASIAAATSAPLSQALGSWSMSFAAWAVPAVAAAALWLPVARAVPPTDAGPMPEGTPRVPLPWRQRTARLLAGFLVVQSWQFFASLAWLAPTHLAAGWTPEQAGYLLSAFLAGQLVGGLTGPVAADRVRDHRLVLIVATACATVGFTGMWLAPQAAPWAWAGTLGVGQGSAFAVGLALLVRYAASPAASARLAGMCFLLSYTTASVGPSSYGALRDATGAFTGVWASLAVLMVAQTALVLALRPDLARTP